MQKKYIILTLLTISFVVLLFVPMQAAFANSKKNNVLFVSPHRVTMESKQRVQILNVSNHSDVARRYDLKVIDQVMQSNGTTASAKGKFKYSAKPILRFVPKRFTLKPGERQVIRVMAKRGKKRPDGDYHSHLLFKEVPLRNQDGGSIMSNQAGAGGVSFEVKAVYGVAVPIIVQVGKISSSLDITSAAIGVNEKGRKALAIKAIRTGNAEASGQISAVHIVGDKKTDIIPKQWLRMYREVDNLDKKIALKKLDGYDLSGGRVVITLIDDPKAKPPKVIDTLEFTVP